MPREAVSRTECVRHVRTCRTKAAAAAGEPDAMRPSPDGPRRLDFFFIRKIASNRYRGAATDRRSLGVSGGRSIDRERASAGTWAATASRERRVSSRLRALGESSAASPKPPGKVADEMISPAQTVARRETRRARRARSDVRLA